MGGSYKRFLVIIKLSSKVKNQEKSIKDGTSDNVQITYTDESQVGDTNEELNENTDAFNTPEDTFGSSKFDQPDQNE